MTENIRDDHFAGARAEHIEIIYAVVNNLPCPVCSAHAKHYFQADWRHWKDGSAWIRT
jgi:hypothetical protein